MAKTKNKRNKNLISVIVNIIASTIEIIALMAIIIYMNSFEGATDKWYLVFILFILMFAIIIHFVVLFFAFINYLGELSGKYTYEYEKEKELENTKMETTDEKK